MIATEPQPEVLPIHQVLLERRRKLKFQLAACERDLVRMGVELVDQGDIELIQEIVAADFGVTARDLRGPCRQRRFAFPRQIGIWLCCELTKHSLEKIGVAFGRHRTLATYTRDEVKLRISSSPFWKNRCERCVALVQPRLERWTAGRE